MSGRERSVGRLCTKICMVGKSRWTVLVPGMRCRKEETLLLSEAAFTVSMVISVRLLSGRQTTRWMRVAWRAALMLSCMAMVEEVRGVPSLLMRRRRSLWVISVTWEEGGAGGEEVAAGGAVCGAFTGGGGAGFLAFLPATCDQRGTPGGRVGFGARMCGAAGAGPASAGEAGLEVGVGDSLCREHIRVSSLLRPWCMRRPEDSVYSIAERSLSICAR